MTTGDSLPSTELAPARKRPSLPGSGTVVIDAELDEPPRRALRDRLRVLAKYSGIAGCCLGLSVGVAALVSLIAPRLYTATTRLQLARQSPIQLRLEENVLRLDDEDRAAAGVSTFLATQGAILRSRDIAERVILSHGLAENDAFVRPGPPRGGLLAVSGRLLSLFRPRGWEAPASGTGDDEAAAAGPVPAALLDRYMRYLDVQDVRGTDLIEVRFTTPNPALSAFLAAAHAQAYLEANEEARLATNATAKDFLGRQLRESRERVERAQAALSSFAAAHPNVAVNQEQQVVVQRIAELSSLLTKAEATRIGLESRQSFVTAAKSERLAYFFDRPGVQKLHLELLEVRAERATLDPRLGPNHPQIVRLREHEREVERQLLAEVNQETAAIRGRHAAALLRETALRRKLAQQEEAALELRDLGARYDLLKGDLQTAHDLHASLLKQQMETAVNGQLTASNVRVVERAEVPAFPTKPNVPLNLTLGVVVGMLLGASSAFLCEHLDRSLKSAEEAASLLQVPVLATVPNFDLAARSLRRAGGSPTAVPGDELVVRPDSASVVAEAFRALRSAILFSQPMAPPKVILVTSAAPGEGKTVSCLNLAAALAETGARVLLLDLDLRHPGCHRALRLPNERGVSTFLAGQAELADLAQAVDGLGLTVVPAGPVPPNPAPLIGSARLRDAIDGLADAYDFVVLDSPPVLPVADAVVLAREADGVVLVVKGHDTPRDLVRQARERLLQANAHMLGAVINNVDLAWGNLYLYYSGYAAAPVGPLAQEPA
jgi:capsular exopolysaccharide synthesis family protein